MIPVDSELLNNTNCKHAVRKPSHWSNVWHPYLSLDVDLDKVKIDYSHLTLGRFEDVNEI